MAHWQRACPSRRASTGTCSPSSWPGWSTVAWTSSSDTTTTLMGGFGRFVRCIQGQSLKVCAGAVVVCEYLGIVNFVSSRRQSFDRTSTNFLADMPPRNFHLVDSRFQSLRGSKNCDSVDVLIANPYSQVIDVTRLFINASYRHMQRGAQNHLTKYCG